jgi:hypothetical protein
MFHLSDSTLKKLRSGSLSAVERGRIERHVEECRACARRPEEWRDLFPAVDHAIPEIARRSAPMRAHTASGLLVVPSESHRPWWRLNPHFLAWMGIILLAAGLGWGGFRMLGKEDNPEGSFGVNPEPAYTPVHPGTTPSVSTDPRVGDSLLISGAGQPSLGRPDDATTTAVAAAPSPAGLPVSRGFSTITVGDAMHRLGGPLRGLAGVEPDHLETAPGTAARGSMRRLPVVRVVYRSGDTGRILIDLQRIPVDSSGFRPNDDPTLESGAVRYDSGPDGMNSATWIDDDGYRISVSALASPDSLKVLVQQVR